jgi:hypothetical protein
MLAGMITLTISHASIQLMYVHSSRKGERPLKVTTAKVGRVVWINASNLGDRSIKRGNQGNLFLISSYESKEATAPTGTSISCCLASMTHQSRRVPGG